MSRSLIVGSQAPKFKYNLADGSSDSLANYLGGKVLICFYPQDNTPGCTSEACSLSDSIKKFDKQKVKVVISIFGRSTPVELDYFQVESER